MKSFLLLSILLNLEQILSIILINSTLPYYLLTPTETESYHSNITGEWEFQIDTENETHLLEIDVNSYLRGDDRLTVYVCNTKTFLYDTNSSNLHHVQIYSQDDLICVEFNASSQEMGNRNYYWRVYFKLFKAEFVPNEVALSKHVPINVNQVTNYSKLTISGSDKTSEIYYQGVEPNYPTSGVLYAYNASFSLTNLIGIFPYPSGRGLWENNITIISSNVNQVTLFYVGVSTNTIMIVSRIAEYHAANCDQDQNLLFLSNNNVHKEIKALNSGTCIFSLIIPISDLEGYYNEMFASSPEYNGASSVSLVAGYNASYPLVEFNYKPTGIFDYIYIFGTIVSFLIPPNGRLICSYGSGLVKVGFERFHFSDDHFFQIFMSPNYPYSSHANVNKSDLIEYFVDYASITLKIFAFIPEQSYFTIYNSNTTFVNITAQNYTNTITFNSTQFQIDFISYNSTVYGKDIWFRHGAVR